MNRNLKFFLAAFLCSIPVWWSFDILAHDAESFFLSQQLQHNPQMLAAYASQARLEKQLEREYPLGSIPQPSLKLNSQAVLSTLIKEDGTQTVLFEKNSTQPLLIASLSKLMTSLVALESYSPSQRVVITPEIVAEQGQSGLLRPNQVFTVKDLLHLTLMESSNDAAAALASPLGRTDFIARMNQRAQEMGLSSTSFGNPTGLDAFFPQQKENYSSAKDVTRIAVHLRKNYPQVFDILSQREFALYMQNGTLHHTIRNTNVLLEYHEWPTQILGGKTGYTPRAKEALLLLVESPDKNGYIINVILGSQDRFGEMKKLLAWILDSYQWSR